MSVYYFNNSPICLEELLMTAKESGFYKEGTMDFMYAKAYFCNKFDMQMKSEDNPEYSENIYDFIYNLYAHKAYFHHRDFERILAEFKDQDFKDRDNIAYFISIIYNKLVRAGGVKLLERLQTDANSSLNERLNWAEVDPKERFKVMKDVANFVSDLGNNRI